MRVVGVVWWRKMKLINSVHGSGFKAMGVRERGISEALVSDSQPVSQ